MDREITPSKALESETRARRILVGHVDCKGAATETDDVFWGKVDMTLREGVYSRAVSSSHGAVRHGRAAEPRDTREEVGQRW